MDDDVIRFKVFPVLTWLVFIMTASSYTVSKVLAGTFGVTAQSYALQILLNPVGVIIITVLYFLFFGLALATSRYTPLNIITATLFALIMGAGLYGTVFFLADQVSAQILPEALILTTAVFIIAVGFQWVTRRDLSHWSWWITFGLLVVLGLAFAQFIVQATLFRIVIDLFVVVVFTFVVMWDLWVIREQLPNEEWMHGVLEFFLDFANILIRIIWLLIQIAAESQ